MNITFNKQSAVPYYHQVKESVKALIASGELKPGEMLPSELSLSAQLGISRLVVHRAFRELVTEGLLIRKRAVGTFVAPPIKRSYTVTGPLFSMTENLSADALEPSNTILLQEVLPAGGEVAAELKLSASAPADPFPQPAPCQAASLCHRGNVSSLRPFPGPRHPGYE